MSRIASHHSETLFFGLGEDAMAFEIDMVQGETYDFTGNYQEGNVYNGKINWGDGSGTQLFTERNSPSLTHVGQTTGPVVLRVTGSYPAMRNETARLNDSILRVLNLGNVGWNSLYSAFKNCSRLTSFKVGDADTTLIDNYSGMFDKCASLIDPVETLNGLDFGGVYNISSMFSESGITGTLKLDASFDLSDVRFATSFAEKCPNLVKITIEDQVMDGLETLELFANNCASLTRINLRRVIADEVLCTFDHAFDWDQTSMGVLSVLDLTGSKFKPHTMRYTFASQPLTYFIASAFDMSECINLNRAMKVPYGNSKQWTTNLSVWNISKVAGWIGFLNNTSLTTDDYSECLLQWVNLDVVDDQTWFMGNSTHSNEIDVIDAKDTLITNNNLTIVDGGEV